MKELMNVMITKNQREWWSGLSKLNKAKFCISMLAFNISLFGVTAEDAPIWWYLVMVLIMGLSVWGLNSVPSEELED